MAIQTNVEVLDVTLLLKGDGGSAQSAAVAEFALQELEEAKRVNQLALGSVPDYEAFVDGRRGAPLGSVKPDGTIEFQFHLASDVILWIDEMLIEFSPVKTGRYQRSHVLFVDGVEVDPKGVIPDGAEFVLINLQPYAEEIENDLSRQAPDGVFQAVAVLANARFGRGFNVQFAYREAPARAPHGDNNRRPAIIITVL